MNEDQMKKLADELSATNERLNQKMADLEEREAKFEKERAAYNPLNPSNANNEKAVALRDLNNGMKEKRTVTLSGAGAVNVVADLIKVAAQKSKIASRVRYFYGANSNTVVPVLSARPALPSKAAEGATSLSADSTMAQTVTEIKPYAWYSEVPVSYENVKMAAFDVEAEMQNVFRDSFISAMDNAIVAGTGASNTMKGIFADVPSANQIACGATGLPKLGDVLALAEKLVDMDIQNPCIVMSGTVHAALLSEETTQYSFVQEEIARNNSVLGCEIIVTGKAPSATTADTVIVWGGDLGNYAVAVAADLTVDPIKTKGTTVITYQAIMAFNGAVLNSANTFALKTV